MTSQNKWTGVESELGPHVTTNWDWLKARLDRIEVSDASQILGDWMTEQLEALESTYADLVTEASLKRAAGLLVKSSRR